MSDTAPSPQAASPAAPPTQRADFAQIRAVAKGQREILWLVLAQILSSMGSFFFPPLLLLNMALGLLSIFAIYRLARSLGKSAVVRILYCIGGFFPLLALLSLLLLNAQATGYLQARGLRVGLMGVSDKSLSAAGG